MKTVAEKQILMAADFAGYPLKEAIKEYSILKRKAGRLPTSGSRPIRILTTRNSCSTVSA